MERKNWLVQIGIQIMILCVLFSQIGFSAFVVVVAECVRLDTSKGEAVVSLQ
jgi:hypothetical protein